MLKEIRDELGFTPVELGHGTRISLMPGIQKMHERGEITFSSLHNFCPLPVEVMHASPDCYKFSAGTARERERAVKQTLQTIDFAERLGAPFVVLHCGEVPMNPITDELIKMAENGQLLSREYVQRKINAVKKREAGAPWHLERVKECLKPIVEYAAQKNVRLGIEGRRGYEEMPNEKELPGPARRAELTGDRLLARLRPHPDQGEPRLPEPRGMAALDRPARLRLSPAGRDLARPRPSAAFAGHVDLDKLVPLLAPGCAIVWEMSPRKTPDEIRRSVSIWKERFGE
jgi:hypothetical protein